MPKYAFQIDAKFSYDKVTEKRKITDIHYHSEHELYYLIDGETKYFIGDEFFHIRKGNFIFVPKGMIHKTDSEDCLYNERIVLSLNDRIFDYTMQPLLEELAKSKLICLPEKHLPSITELMQKIEKEYHAKHKYKEQMMESYIRELVVRLCRYKTDEKQHLNESDLFIYRISEYISNNLSDEISLTSLSKTFSLSEGHLSRKFKAVLGVGINEYIRYVRIQRAAQLLLDTDKSITQISGLCGFNDSNYFSTVFKSTMGTTPHKYRKINLN